ncbi:unnamed protein product [Soboliphyme baturini]|uniref:Secreted protein n=1 Tax=Soboliphyme baturini TaxID=241478 RepID=A0A183ISB7_9BILA|nr:unnamed protein product [Soboliphyme baturini]
MFRWRNDVVISYSPPKMTTVSSMTSSAVALSAYLMSPACHANDATGGVGEAQLKYGRRVSLVWSVLINE